VEFILRSKSGCPMDVFLNVRLINKSISRAAFRLLYMSPNIGVGYPTRTMVMLGRCDHCNMHSTCNTLSAHWHTYPCPISVFCTRCRIYGLGAILRTVYSGDVLESIPISWLLDDIIPRDEDETMLIPRSNGPPTPASIDLIFERILHVRQGERHLRLCWDRSSKIVNLAVLQRLNPTNQYVRMLIDAECWQVRG
jgi:hypothetical protein